MSDDAFVKWCESLKPCRYCGRKFIGPVCACERKKVMTASAMCRPSKETR